MTSAVSPSNDLVPPNNRRAYEVLFVLEVGLREWIISELSGAFGPTWQRTALPGEVWKKVKDARDYERKSPWSRSVPHHPLYYVDFPDLCAIMERGDNWTRVFQERFARKDITASLLRSVEPVRNKVAHNRVLSDGDLLMLENAATAVRGAVGANTFDNLVQSRTSAPSLRDDLANLEREIGEASVVVSRVESLQAGASIARARAAWWLDPDYLGGPVDSTRNAVALLAEYVELPRGRGVGYQLESWLRVNEFEHVCEQAGAELRHILNLEA